MKSIVIMTSIYNFSSLFLIILWNSRAFTIINHYSMKSKWTLAEHWKSHYSPNLNLKRTIVLAHTNSLITQHIQEKFIWVAWGEAVCFSNFSSAFPVSPSTSRYNKPRFVVDDVLYFFYNELTLGSNFLFDFVFNPCPIPPIVTA